MNNLVGKRIKEKRKENNLTQKELAALVNVSPQVISNWERGYTPEIGNEDLLSLSKALKTPADYLLGNSNHSDMPSNSYSVGEMYRVPVIGQIPAGSPCMIFESVEEYEDIPRSWLNGHPEEYFVLDVKGDSMEGARIFDGDRALMHKQPSFENGQICDVGLINDPTEHYATLKYVYQIDSEYVELVPDNPKYARLKVKRIDICIYGILKYSFRRH